MAICIPDEAYTSGRLDLQKHARLLANLDRHVETAGILPAMVWSRLSDYCGEKDRHWVQTIRTPGTKIGMAYVGITAVPVEDKMMAIAGACLRNYIDARVMSVQTVIDLLRDSSMPLCHVLLIPNFCLDKEDGGNLPNWQSSALLGLLLTRMTRGLRTVIAVSNLDVLQKNYGDSFRTHVMQHFVVI